MGRLPAGLARLGVWVGMMFVVGTIDVSHVAAQSRSNQDAEARGLFDAATAAIDDGRFEDALGYFERAYALSHRPAMLFNLASVCERLRRDEEAISYYQRYLGEIPDAENRRFVEGRIEFLRAGLERRPPDEPVAQEPPPEPDRAPLVAGADLQTPIEAPPPRPHPHRLRRAIILSVVALAVTGAATGIALALRDPGFQAPLPGDVGAGGVVFTLVGP